MKINYKFGLLPLLTIVAVIILNYLGQDFFFRLDLTADKRYSISEVTRQSLDSLRQPLYVKVFLEGDFPPTVKQFEDAVRTTLLEMKAYASSPFHIEFIDPAKDEKARKLLADHHIQPIPVRTSSSALQQTEVYMYPTVVMSYGDRQLFIDLMKGTTAERDINLLLGAEAQLEYKFTSALRHLVLKERPRIGVLKGHGEYTPAEMPELLAELSKSYALGPVSLKSRHAIFPKKNKYSDLYFDLILIAQPDSAFSETDKYELDQYLMRGGKLLWLMNQGRVSINDLTRQGSTLTGKRALNLDDMFFHYGVKLNYDILQDAYCGFIDVAQQVEGHDQVGQQHWLYYPVINSFPQHPITRNLDHVLLRYAGSLDTLKVLGIQREVILQTSPYSRSLKTPVVVDFGHTLEEYARMARQQALPTEFQTGGNKITGVVLSGNFTSLFEGRDVIPMEQSGNEPPTPVIRESNGKGSIILLTNGALARENDSRLGGQGMPLDNKALLVNAVDYLAGDAALIQIRDKQVRVRTLDPLLVRGHELLYQILNVVLPVLLVVLFGILRHRRRVQRNRTR